MPTILASVHCRPSTVSRPSVLVLDASAGFGLSVIRSLRKYGVHAVLATSGAQALQTCKTHNVRALIFNDDARGARHHLADLLRSHADLPTAIIGGEPGSELAGQLGRTAHYAKPLEINVLVDQLSEWVGPQVSEFGGSAAPGWGAPAVAAATVAVAVTPGDRATRQLTSAEAELGGFGSAPTREMTRLGEPDRPTSKRVTGSYSIVHRRQSTAQMAAI